MRGMKAYGITDIGKVREINQDKFATVAFGPSMGFAVVCDGMGGPGGGQIASDIAVSTITNEIVRELKSCKDGEDVRKMVVSAVQKANLAIFDEGIGNRDLSGMGTTLVLAIYSGDKAIIGNIGDSRAYHIMDGTIVQISKDHSIVQQMLDNGRITKNEAKNHPQKNIITRALGVGTSCSIDFFDVEVKATDSILLCTDGLTNHVDENELSFELSLRENPEDTLSKLVSMANERGGTDNITAVLLSPDNISD